MKLAAFTLAAALAAGAAGAHETGVPHAHPHKPALATGSVGKTGPNGGPVAMAGHHPVEMVARGTDLVFYVTDEDGQPADTAGATGRAIVTQGGKNTTVPLSASEPSRLAGALPAPLSPGAKVVFSAKLHGHTAQARFEVK